VSAVIDEHGETYDSIYGPGAFDEMLREVVAIAGRVAMHEMDAAHKELMRELAEMSVEKFAQWQADLRDCIGYNENDWSAESRRRPQPNRKSETRPDYLPRTFRIAVEEDCRRVSNHVGNSGRCWQA